jgi:hypothetical protein
MNYSHLGFQTKLVKGLLLVGVNVISTFVLSGCGTGVTTTPNLPNIVLNGSENRPPIKQSNSAIETFSDAFAELEIEDQSGDGRQIVIEEIRITNRLGFVGILDAEGKLLGYSKVTNQSQPVSVRLETAVSSNSKLFARLYADNGDISFDELTDFPVLDDDGELVIEDFDYWLSK